MIWRVSWSGRTCGRPRQRRSWVVSISAMLLHDACHSIDTPHVCPIWKTSSFLNGPTPGKGYQGVTVMTRHSPAFEAERPVPAADTVKDLVQEKQKYVRT